MALKIPRAQPVLSRPPHTRSSPHRAAPTPVRHHPPDPARRAGALPGGGACGAAGWLRRWLPGAAVQSEPPSRGSRRRVRRADPRHRRLRARRIRVWRRALRGRTRHAAPEPRSPGGHRRRRGARRRAALSQPGRLQESADGLAAAMALGVGRLPVTRHTTGLLSVVFAADAPSAAWV